SHPEPRGDRRAGARADRRGGRRPGGLRRRAPRWLGARGGQAVSGVWGTVLDVLAAICLLGGSFLSLAAGIGLTRFPDLLARMHAATKPQVLGVILMMLGLGIRLRNGPIIWMLVLVALFQLLTSPVSAHMVARAGYRTGKVRHDLLVVDELTRDLESA